MRSLPPPFPPVSIEESAVAAPRHPSAPSRRLCLVPLGPRPNDRRLCDARLVPHAKASDQISRVSPDCARTQVRNLEHDLSFRGTK